MAVTKLLNIKQSSRGNARHLYHSIRYILNPEKTKDGLLAGGNVSTEHDTVYRAMMDTKEEWNKKEGRQGYHFVISWKPGETDEDTAYQVIKEFCEEYLGDAYEYVFSVHDDKDHLHGHIVFNSVSRINGYKYRYEKGDWETQIQPVTDRICERHGLNKLEYESVRKGKSYAEYNADKKGRNSWKKIIRADIDYAVSNADSDEEFLARMHDLGYRIKSGQSEPHGAYLSFLAPGGQERAWRSYNLGEGYTLLDIQHRIGTEKKIYQYPVTPRLKRCRIRTYIRELLPRPRYQVRRVRQLYQTQTRFARKNPYAIDQAQVRKNLLHIDRLREECVYLMRAQIHSSAELKEREEELIQAERFLKSQQGIRYTMREDPTYQEYQDLTQALSQTPAWDDRFEELLDRLDELEEMLPIESSQIDHDLVAAREQLASIRAEKRIIRRLQREDQEVKITVLQEHKKFSSNSKMRQERGGEAWQRKSVRKN